LPGAGLSHDEQQGTQRDQHDGQHDACHVPVMTPSAPLRQARTMASQRAARPMRLVFNGTR
jgi:hypothetical protein